MCRTALSALESARAETCDFQLHNPRSADDLYCLARANVTCHVDDATAKACDRRLATGKAVGTSAEALNEALNEAPLNTPRDDSASPSAPAAAGPAGGNGVFGSGSLLDPLVQSLAACHTDLLALLFRLELRLGGRQHHHSEAKAQRAAKKESKQKRGKAEAKGKSTAGRSKATMSREGTPAGGGAWAADDPLFAPSVWPPMVEAAEARALAEVKRNSVAKALLLLESAGLKAALSAPALFAPSDTLGGLPIGGGSLGGRPAAKEPTLGHEALLLAGQLGGADPAPPRPPHPKSPLGADVSKLLGDAASCLVEAEMKELDLLAQLPSFRDCPAAWEDGAELAAGGEDEDAELTARAAATAPAPPAPSVVGRTDGSVTLQPRRWFLAPRQKRGAQARPRPNGSVSSAGERPSGAAFYRVFGKLAGSGTDVMTSNKELLGTAVLVPYDPETGTAQAITIRSL